MNRLIVRLSVAVVFSFLLFLRSDAQVNSVEFGKNRVQYQKYTWKYYQTENFNSYFKQDGLELAKYVAQVAERELPQLEDFVEYGMQRRANLVIYNSFDEMQQSNIGLGIDWQNTGGVTKLVNNKMMLFFDGNHEHLKRQVRQGIAGILVSNILFGDDLGEFAANQTLLDLPKWLTDGYIDYAAEEWSTELDDQLKSALLSGDYNNFYQLAYAKPLLAGHALWYYIGNKYGKPKTTYMLYLARIYRNLNSATQKIAKKKFKEVLKDFMNDLSQQYYRDIRSRKIVPKGQLSVVEEIGKKDFIRFNANPVPRNFSYAVTEFKQGKYSVVYHDNMYNRKTLLSYGARSREDEINPNMPILAWDGKGSRLAVIYNKEGRNNLFVYDVVKRIKVAEQQLPMFTQVQDAKYMLDANTLLLSAVKSGHTDIFVYKIDKQSVEQITNDIYDDLDPAFVAFPGKTGIIFSSNRPNPDAVGSDSAIASNHYNIFLIDNWNKSEYKQISQLTNVSYGNARFPSQYQTTHFTFVSDENGIANRYAGFFKSERAGLDTLVFVGDEVLRNPSRNEVDSVLKDWNKNDVDSVGFASITNDSAYVFPLTNYQSSLLETRTAGDNSQVSEVVRQGNYKFLYRLKVDENALRRRNVSAKPTEFRRKEEEQARLSQMRVMMNQPPTDSTGKKADFFQSEFANEKKDSSNVGKVFDSEELPTSTILRKAKLFEYRPPKFFNDYVVAGLNNTVFAINKYQPYTGTGPIDPSNGNDLNGLIRMGTVDLLEDYKISGGLRVAPNLRDNDVLFEFSNLKKRLDWGFTYYRTNTENIIDTSGRGIPTGVDGAFAKQHSNYYLARLSYPFDKVRSIRFTIGPRFDKDVFPAADIRSLKAADRKKTYGQFSAEYIHDNTLNPALNIWQGLRWKAYIDWFTQLSKIRTTEGKYLFNAGFDARHYLPLYKNVIWAVRAAGDFSWGNQKVIYYLGGVDGWMKFRENLKEEPNGTVSYRYFDPANSPAPDNDYAFQALAVNMRGFKQNAANGNNALVINSELRMPVFSTLLNRPINNALLRNFQLVQFIDLGTAWNGAYNKLARPSVTYSSSSLQGVTVRVRAGGIGPFAGGYGFGARSTLLGYFVKFDAAWQMDGLFRGKPQTYLAVGVDF